jgi:hypothetical protein
MYTCAYCRTGVVNELPANCPECERTLNAIVENRYLYREQKPQLAEEGNNIDVQKNPPGKITGSL